MGVRSLNTLASYGYKFGSTGLEAVNPASFDVYWIANFGGNSNDTGRGIAVDSLKNVYITGITQSAGAGSNDAFIAKFDSSGTIQWQRTLGGANSDNGFAIAVDSSHNVYICGDTDTGGSQNDEILVAKYSPSGTIQWQRTLGNTGNDKGRGIAVDSSHNVYVTGYARNTSSSPNRDELFLAKYNSSGTIQGHRFLGGSTSDGDDSRAMAIDIDSSDNVYMCGSTDVVGNGNDDLLITKYNSSLQIQWQRTLGNSVKDEGYGCAVDSLGNVYITGYTSHDVNTNRIVIAKYNTSGTIQWQRTLAANLHAHEGYACAVDGSGNVYVTGIAVIDLGTDFAIAKYNTSGVIQWQRNLRTTGGQTDVARAIVTDGSNNFYVCGYTGSPSNVLLAKLPGDGSLTGTYGSYEYAAITLTDAAGTFTDAAATLTDAAGNLTGATSSLTDSSSSLTSTTTDIE
tara:strand:- start:4460 stop:5824 length:1365 start_codon:yes stop_codon:yes gene_type:complete